MPIKKLQLDNLHPANPINDIVLNVNENFDAVIEALNNVSVGDGVVGPKGDRGDPGADGREGPQGPQGERGEKGDTGEPGPAGKDGKDGSNGEPGPQGLPGKDGKDGLQGPKGDQGDVGAQGIQGIQGVKGDPGGTKGFDIPNTGGTAGWVNLGTLTTANAGNTLYMRIVAHAGYNADFSQNQLTEVYFKTSNGSSNVNGFYADGSASRNSVLGGSGGAPSVIRVVQNSQTSYTFYGYFATWSNGSHYTYSIDGASSWTHAGTIVAEPTGTSINITPTVSDIKSASGYVDAGTFVSLDNIRATVTTSGNRGLSLATVSGSVTLSISCTFGYINGVGGNATSWPGTTYTTTPSGPIFNYHFPNAGDGSVYLLNDYTNKRFYRVTLVIGYAYTNNFISIERLI